MLYGVGHDVGIAGRSRPGSAGAALRAKDIWGRAAGCCGEEACGINPKNAATSGENICTSGSAGAVTLILHPGT